MDYLSPRLEHESDDTVFTYTCSFDDDPQYGIVCSDAYNIEAWKDDVQLEVTKWMAEYLMNCETTQEFIRKNYNEIEWELQEKNETDRVPE